MLSSSGVLAGDGAVTSYSTACAMQIGVREKTRIRMMEPSSIGSLSLADPCHGGLYCCDLLRQSQNGGQASQSSTPASRLAIRENSNPVPSANRNSAARAE